MPLAMKVASEGASLEAAGVEPVRLQKAQSSELPHMGLARVALEPQPHRLRPEGLPLSSGFSAERCAMLPAATK